MLLEDEVAYAQRRSRGQRRPPAAVHRCNAVARTRGATTRKAGPSASHNSPRRAQRRWLTVMATVCLTAYEIETYGSTNAVGSSITGDTDGDGASDAAEYIAGTIATNANSKFQVSASVLPGGNVLISTSAPQPITGPGYFGLERRYALEQTTNIANPASWNAIPGYANLPAIGSLVTFTPTLMTNTVWSTRGRVWLW
jgi:hypothetical protein